MEPEPSTSTYQRALHLASVAFAWAGVIVPLSYLVAGRFPSLHQLLFACVLAVVGVIGGRLTIEFRFSGTEIPVSPDGVAWVLGVLVLPLPVAMLMSIAVAMSHVSYGLKRALLNGGAVASAMAVTYLAVHTIGVSLSPGYMLLYGVMTAVIFEIVQVGEGLAVLESRQRGGAREHLAESRFVAGFEIMLPAIAVGLVAPFLQHLHDRLDQPVIVGGILVAFQVITYAGLNVLKSEQVHRAKSRFLTDSFSRYVPASVVDRLSEEQATVTMGGEEREISVMFLDVRGFTSWSEKLAPEDIITQLNDLLAEVSQAIFDTDGTLDKFTGDGLMAFWGAPSAQPDHAMRACTCARVMLERVDACNERRALAGKPPFYIGIGVHSGRAVVGNVGHEERHDYTAIGDTVNLAARLEAATKDAGCGALISGATHMLLGTDLASLGDLPRHGELTVKGRAEAVEAYVLAPAQKPPAATPDLHSAA